MAVEVFSPIFKDRLEADGFRVADIQAECVGESVQQSYDAVHRYLDAYYPHRFLRSGFYNQRRDGVLPVVSSAIEGILAPWRATGCTEFLPTNITLKELSRIADVHPRHIFNALEMAHPTFNVGEQKFDVKMSDPIKLAPGSRSVKEWQQLHAEKDAEFFDVKLNLVGRNSGNLQ